TALSQLRPALQSESFAQVPFRSTLQPSEPHTTANAANNRFIDSPGSEREREYKARGRQDAADDEEHVSGRRGAVRGGDRREVPLGVCAVRVDTAAGVGRGTLDARHF